MNLVKQMGCHFRLEVILVVCIISTFGVWCAGDGNQSSQTEGQPWNPPDCPDDGARIIGGHDAVEGEFPFLVAIMRRSGRANQFCGGALLTELYTLSAAHCCFGQTRKASYIKLVAGTLDPHEFYGRSPHEQSRWALAIYTHPNYSDSYTNKQHYLKQENLEVDTIPWFTSSPPFSTYDFAIFEADEPFVLNGVHVAAIPLPHFKGSLDWLDTWSTSGNVTCTVAGWGKINPSKWRIKDKVIGLRQTHLKLKPHEVCENALGPWYDRNTMICAKEDFTDACQGDSGGPFFCKFGVNQPMTYVAVVSWGLGCANPTNPGVFARLDVGEPWIRALTQVGEGGSSRAQEMIISRTLIAGTTLIQFLCRQKSSVS